MANTGYRADSVDVAGATGWILVFASTSSSFVTQAVIGVARHVYVPQLIYREVSTLFNWPLAAAIAVVLPSLVYGLAALIVANFIGFHPSLWLTVVGHITILGSSPNGTGDTLTHRIFRVYYLSV